MTASHMCWFIILIPASVIQGHFSCSDSFSSMIIEVKLFFNQISTCWNRGVSHIMVTFGLAANIIILFNPFTEYLPRIHM